MAGTTELNTVVFVGGGGVSKFEGVLEAVAGEGVGWTEEFCKLLTKIGSKLVGSIVGGIEEQEGGSDKIGVSCNV